MVKGLKCSCHGDSSLNIREKSSIGNENINYNFYNYFRIIYLNYAKNNSLFFNYL